MDPLGFAIPESGFATLLSAIVQQKSKGLSTRIGYVLAGNMLPHSAILTNLGSCRCSKAVVTSLLPAHWEVNVLITIFAAAGNAFSGSNATWEFLTIKGPNIDPILARLLL